MNIIQQQELARNSSEQQLISLAEQPNPTIMPPYLVTGELMRRKSIREKMAQAPQQSVSEEVLAEAVQNTTPKGIGALTSNMQAPMAAPQEEVMTESITETGIAPIPQSIVGQNYAEGGVVGYGIGGKILQGGKYIVDKIMSNPIKSTIGAGGVGYVATRDSEDETITKDGEEEVINNTVTEAAVRPTPTSPYGVDASKPNYSYLKEDTEGYGRKKANEYREFLGVDPNQAKYSKRLQKLEQRNMDDEGDLLNNALITGGLAMAGGQSNDFLSNLTTGATAGFGSYTKGTEDIRKAESDLFALETEIGRAQRAEEMAIGLKGFESQEAVEARNRGIDLAEVKAQAELEKLKVTLEVAKIGSTIYGYNKNAQKDILAHANSLGLKENSAALNSLLLEQNPTPAQKKQIEHMRELVDNILKRAEVYVVGKGPAGNIPNSGQTTASGQTIPAAGFGKMTVE